MLRPARGREGNGKVGEEEGVGKRRGSSEEVKGSQGREDVQKVWQCASAMLRLVRQRDAQTHTLAPLSGVFSILLCAYYQILNGIFRYTIV